MNALTSRETSEQAHEITSIITLSRRRNLRNITSGKASAIPYVTHIAFGDGGCDSEGRALVPDERQETLNHEIARYPIDGVSYPNETTARYTVTIPKNDLVGQSISESALVNGAGGLDAIKNSPPKYKGAEEVFEFTFDDQF